jgi:alpha-L-fucosidase
MNFVMKRLLMILLAALAVSPVARSQKFKGLATTPPMGFNTWNTFFGNINEQLVRDIADVFVSAGLRDAGYEYIVIDDCWSARGRDAEGNLVPDSVKFPGGIKALADYVHERGLKLGIYGDAGWKTCAGYPGSRGHEYQDARKFAEWGVDYLKYDWCNTLTPHPTDVKITLMSDREAYAAECYQTMRDALYTAGRPVLFSICEGGLNQCWNWAPDIGHCWRVTPDIRPEFRKRDRPEVWFHLNILEILDLRNLNEIRKIAGRGRWNDFDMLQVGNGSLTLHENQSHFALWAMLNSPLMLGNDLRIMTDEVRQIVTNRDIIALNQDALGVQAYEHRYADSIQIFAKPLANGDWALLFLNRDDADRELVFDWQQETLNDEYFNHRLSFDAPNVFKLTDLYAGRDLGTTRVPLRARLASHQCLVLRLTRTAPVATVRDRARNLTLPRTDYHYQKVQYYIEREPDPDYLHASEQAHEAFRDLKFAVRIHWGMYSVWQMNGESWGFLNLSREKKMEYNALYKTFNPTAFNADEWMSLFKRSGIRAFAFTTKHHEGFSMYHTKTRVVQRANYLDTTRVIEPCDLHYSIEETPFRRDIVRELCDAAHKNDIKINLYFSHPDWYDADFRPYNNHPLTTEAYLNNDGNYGYEIGRCKYEFVTPDPTADETARMLARHREQLRELLTNYGKIDMLCFDQWMGRDVWQPMKETLKMLRRLQPDVMFRCRGIGNYGDYYTPEGFVPGNRENTNMPWMTIYPLGSSFSYDRDSSRYKGAAWIVHNIIDCAAKGGSFMVGIGPDGDGRFHPTAVAQLEATGRWLAVNGRGIYGTRAREVWHSGDFLFTRSKDGRRVYAFTEKAAALQAAMLHIPSVTPRKGSKVSMLGYNKPLQWTPDGDGVNIEIPTDLLQKLPCEYAWGFEFAVEKAQ